MSQTSQQPSGLSERAPDTKTSIRVVHYLRAGWTSCGRPPAWQEDWPDDERWAGPGDEHEVRGCALCVAAVNELKRHGTRSRWTLVQREKARS